MTNLGPVVDPGVSMFDEPFQDGVLVNMDFDVLFECPTPFFSVIGSMLKLSLGSG